MVWVGPGPVRGRLILLLEGGRYPFFALLMAFGFLVLWYPAEPLPRVSGLVLISYVLTPLGRFLLRRFFEVLAGASHEA